jgi:DNA-binding LacI/PurR family transcriptional regulator
VLHQGNGETVLFVLHHHPEAARFTVTFADKRFTKLTHVAVYDMGDVRGKCGSQFERSLHAALADEFHRAGVETDVWVDPRQTQQRYVPWPALLAAAERRQFQALVVTAADVRCLRWLQKVPVPSVFVTSADLPNVVRWEMRQFAELSVRALRQQGCRSVGLISAISTQSENPDGTRGTETEFYEYFVDCCRESGLEMRNIWMRTTPGELLGPPDHEPFGYREFQTLWRNRERPQGLVVYPDSIVPGVLLALSQQAVRVPSDLKLVLHKNDGVGLFCPFPTTFVVCRERDCAVALMAQIENQFRGEPVNPVSLGFRMVNYRPPTEQ